MYYVLAPVSSLILHQTPRSNPINTHRTTLEGKMAAENPYGHLPATQYKSLPFYSWMSFLYVITLIVWGMLCIQYSKEIMSVHLMILVLLSSWRDA